MKTMNTKTKGQLLGLGVLAMLVLGGCASVTNTQGLTESFDSRMEKHGVSEVTLLGFANPGATVGSVEKICKGHETDPRCQPAEIGKYRTGYVRVRDYGFTVSDIPYLAKISELPIEWGADILKVRVKKGEIAWFEGRITKGVNNPECYNDGGFGRGSAGKGGVVCPLLDYDYRKIPMLN